MVTTGREAAGLSTSTARKSDHVVYSVVRSRPRTARSSRPSTSAMSRSTLQVPEVPLVGMGTSSCAPTTSTSSAALAKLPSTVRIEPLTTAPSVGEVMARAVVTVWAEAAPLEATAPPARRVAATSADSQRVRLIVSPSAPRGAESS